MASRFFISNSAHPCTEIALDANRIRAYYLANGWQETATEADADQVIVSTCAYNQQYEDAAMADLAARRAHLKPGARFVAVGCLSRINPGRFAEAGAEAVGPLELDRFDAIAPGTVPMSAVHANTVRTDDYRANPFFLRLVSFKEKLERLSNKIGCDIVPDWMATIPSSDWFFIRGAVGCRGRCTYCAVRRAKGRLVSTPPGIILEQTRQAAAAGVREISLAGDDMGAWGSDIGSNLAELLAEMVRIGDGFRINLRFVEPRYFIDLIDRLAPIFETGRISAFCLPIQSGSDRILERMGRDYRIGEVETALTRFAAIGRSRPRLATIIMVGFPGETDEEYAASCRLLDRLPIDLYQILPFEARPDTPAAAMPDQIPDAVKALRHDRLLRAFKLRNVVGLPGWLAARIARLPS
ncbi:MAG TPA: radical SAM protein [Candidatus Ozemobacteraceae bacterium]